MNIFTSDNAFIGFVFTEDNTRHATFALLSLICDPALEAPSSLTSQSVEGGKG